MLPVERKRAVFERRPMQFRHESNDRAQKPEPRAATPSEPSMTRGGSASRKRSIRGKSNHGSILRQPCRYYLKGTSRDLLVSILPNVNSMKTNRDAKQGDKCLFPHETKSQRKATNLTKEKEATTRMLWQL